MKKKMGENYYEAKYDQPHMDYQRIITNDGIDIELVVFYRVDEHIIENSPDHTKLTDKIVKLLRGSGIGQIKITFMDRNE